MGIARVCPYCGADSGAIVNRLKAALAPRGSDGIGTTHALITVNVFLYLAAILVGGIASGGGMFGFLAPDGVMLFRLGSLDPQAVMAGQWWRLILMMFLHGGLLHLAFNCYILSFCGKYLEEELGGKILFFVFIMTGLTGSLASFMASPASSVGASGAVYGLLGTIVTRRRLVDGHFRNPLTQQLLYLLGINVVFGLAVSGIDHAAHGGGFVGGVLCAWVLTRIRLSRVGAAGLMLGTWVAAVATLAAFAMMIVSLFAGAPSDLMTADQCWRDTELAVRSEYLEDLVDSSVRCLQDLPRLEGAANEARDRALQSWGQAILAYQDGNNSVARSGQVSVAVQVKAFFEWEREALPRYGMRLRSAK
jgi:membrane associated rhomboid family serine protease